MSKPEATPVYAPWENHPARTVRRGHFWLPGDRMSLAGNTYQSGPMFVAWEAPVTPDAMNGLHRFCTRH